MLLFYYPTITVAKTVFMENNNDSTLLSKEPYLIFSGEDGTMQILWQLVQTEICNLTWGNDTSYNLGNVNTTEYGDDHQHKYLINNLDFETEYFYRVVVQGDTIKGNFRSSPDENEKTLTFLAYGDTRSQPSHHNDVAEQMLLEIANDTNALSLIIFSGDFVSNGNTETDWDEQFFDGNLNYIRDLMQKVPYLATVGNHEGNGILFAKYFPYPFYSYENNYWSFDYGPAHFTIIDQFSDYSKGSAQYLWIEDDLASSDKQWKFILLHEPGWSAGGGHENNEDVQQLIQPLCVEYGVQFVLNGHNHYYSCAVVEQVVHITTGGGGAPLYNPDNSYPNIIKSVKNYHFCKLFIDDQNLHFEAINDSGAIIHEFDYKTIVADISENTLSANNFLIMPNPVSDITTISFSLQNETRLKVSIYSLSGELVAVVADKSFARGEQKLLWNRTSEGQKADPGIYFLSIELENGKRISKKIVVVDY